MEGRILTFNRAAETITSLAASDVVGRAIAEIMQLPEVFQSLFVPGAIPSGTAAPRVRLPARGTGARSRWA